MKHNIKFLFSAIVPSTFAIVTTAFAEPVEYGLRQNYYGDDIKNSKTVIWSDCCLKDLYDFSAEMHGGWFSAPKSATGIVCSRTDSDCVVQFQVSDGYCKVVQARFEQSGSNVVGWAELAGYTEDGSYYGTIIPTNLFEKATLSQYCIRQMTAIGDVKKTIDVLPAAPDGIVITGGVLQVNVSEDIIVTQKVSGTGGLRFKAEGDCERPFVFDKYLTEADQVVCYDASYLDVVVTNGTLNGDWLSGKSYPGMMPYNVTTNLAEKSITVQLQRAIQYTTYQNRYGIVVRFAQSGTNVVARALISRKAGDGQELGSDVNTWTGAVAKVATSATAQGYGVEKMALVWKSKPIVRMVGTKEFEGGLAADGCDVYICNSDVPEYAHARAINGGLLRLGVHNGFSAVNKHNTYYVGPNSEIQTFGKYAINRSDYIEVNGGAIRHVGSNIYINYLTLRNGARIEGECISIGHFDSSTKPKAVWTSCGTGPNVVNATCRLVRYSGSDYRYPAIFQTDADLTFAANVWQLTGGYEGLRVTKQGASTLTFASGLSTTGQVTIVEGTLELGGTSNLGPLCVQGNSTLKVDDGGVAKFADSHTQSQNWTAGTRLALIGDFSATTNTLSFGTSSGGLAPSQLWSMRANGKKHCKLDDYGWLREYVVGNLIIWE